MGTKRKKHKERASNLPRPRHIWEINPKERVTPSAKIYNRQKAKEKKKSWVDEINWFGD